MSKSPSFLQFLIQALRQRSLQPEAPGAAGLTEQPQEMPSDPGAVPLTEMEMLRQGQQRRRGMLN